MFDPCRDIIDDANTRVHGTLQILQFPFDVSRSDTLFSTPLLVATFLVHRYRWMESGIFVFLHAEEHFCVSATKWAAWNEYVERLTDDRSDVSPQLGVVVPQLRLQRTPPYRTTRHQVDQKVLRCVRATHSIPFQIPLTAPGPGPAERMPRPFMALRFEV